MNIFEHIEKIDQLEENIKLTKNNENNFPFYGNGEGSIGGGMGFTHITPDGFGGFNVYDSNGMSTHYISDGMGGFYSY